MRYPVLPRSRGWGEVARIRRSAPLSGGGQGLKIHFHRKLHFTRVANLVAEIIGAD